jgi:Flp pilus assembly protein TadD
MQRGRGYDLGAALVLAAAVLAVYWNALDGTFILDDWKIVRGDILPVDEGGIGALSNRPVGRWTLAWNLRLGGLDPRPFHAVNLAIHVLAGWLLYGLVRRTLERPGAGGWSDAVARGLGAATALLWVVHPLQTESVTYVAQRLEALMSVFYLACLYCVVRSADAARPLAWHVGAMLALALGAGTKETIVSAPVLVALYDRAFLASSWRELARRRWTLYLLLAFPVGVLVAQQPAIAALLSGGLGEEFAVPAGPGNRAGERATPLTYLATQPGVVLHYLGLAAWPARLCFDYDWPLAAGLDAAPSLIVGALLITAVVAYLVRPALGFPLLAFFVLLAPTSSILPITDPAVEHRMYLPLAPMIALAVVGGWAALRRVAPPRVAAVAGGTIVAGVALALGLRTVERNRDFADEGTMWTDVVGCAPWNPRAHFNLGMFHYREGRFADATTHLRDALTRDPRHTGASFNLAASLGELGDADAAVAAYRQTLAIDPDFAPANLNLGALLLERGEVDEARRLLGRAVALTPDDPNAVNNWANALGRAGDHAEAIEAYRRAVALAPGYAPAWFNLALVLEAEDRLPEAVAAMERAVALAPGWETATSQLARMRADAATPGR